MNSNIMRMCIAVSLFVFCLAGISAAGQHHRMTSEDSESIIKLINPAVTGSLMMMEIPVCLDVLDGYAYVLTDKSLNVVLVEQVSEIKLISTTATCANPIDIAVIANYAYILCPDKGVQVWDISDKVNPVLENTINVENPNHLAVSDDILYVSWNDNVCSNGKITSINNQKPAEPVVEVIVSLNGHLLDFDCNSTGIYAVCEVESSTPGVLSLFNYNFEIRGFSWGSLEGLGADVDSVMINGNILYAVDSSFGIYAYDVESNSPKLLGKLKLKGTPCDIDIYADAAFVCCQSGGLVIVDISDPANMKINNKAKTPGKMLDAVAGGKLVYTVDDYGVQIVKLLD